MADYSELSTLITNAKREALIAEMTCNGWEFENDNVFTQFHNYGESSSSQSVTLDGQASASSYSGGASNDNDEGLAQAALNEFTGAKSKWDTNIDEVISGWDGLEDAASKWDDIKRSLQDATQKVAAGTGNSTSQFGNPDLTDIDFIRQRLPQNSGQTVDNFYRFYGPARLELVLDGHCEVIGCLGIALTGEQKIWTAARTDVVVIMSAAVEAFKQTRDNHDTDWKAIITVVTAGIGLAGAFSAGIPGVAAAFGAAAATGGFLSAAMDALADGKTEETHPYSGSHPDTVYTDLKTAFKTLHERIEAQETGHQEMLSTMLGFVSDNGRRENFHINPGVGLEPEFGNSDDTLDMKYSVLETIGYSAMPQIANAFLQSVDAAQAGQDLSTWYRPYASALGTSIGLGAFGPYDAWESLLYAIYPVMNDTAAEVLRAGEHLAEAAGYVKESDEWARTALDKNYKDVEGAELGWQAPYTPPPPPPRRMGGPQPF